MHRPHCGVLTGCENQGEYSTNGFESYRDSSLLDSLSVDEINEWEEGRQRHVASDSVKSFEKVTYSWVSQLIPTECGMYFIYPCLHIKKSFRKILSLFDLIVSQ